MFTRDPATDAVAGYERSEGGKMQEVWSLRRGSTVPGEAKYVPAIGPFSSLTF